MSQILVHAHAASSWLMATFSELGAVILIVGVIWLTVAGVIRGAEQAWDKWAERQRVRRVQATVDRLLREQGLQAAAGVSHPPRGCGPTSARKRCG